MTAIAIDLWNKRCGIAIETAGIAFAQDIIPRHEVIPVIKKYIASNHYSTIIVWLPHDLYGKLDKQLNKTKSFITKLESLFPDIEILWVDERFTSFVADRTLAEMWSKQNSWKKDALAAAEILQDYLDQKKKK